MRSLIIAEALAARWPTLNISFGLSRQAPYAQACPFTTYLFNRSVTKESRALQQLLNEITPDIVIFDCSGRAAQIRYASQLGAKVVFISQHRKKRQRGLSCRRLPYLDAHWITQFQFVDGALSWFDKVKIKAFAAPSPEFIGPVFHQPSAELPGHLQQLAGKTFVLWSAGGGGHSYNGLSATDIFYQTAACFAEPDVQHLVICGKNYRGHLTANEQITVVDSIPNNQLMSLLQQARLVVTGGGDLMAQAIALKANVVAVAVAKDQPLRIARCVQQQCVYQAPLDSRLLLQQCRYAFSYPLSPPAVAAPGLPRIMQFFSEVFAQ